MNYSVRKAKDMDGEAMLALLPRLAAFELPDSRTAEHLWVHDAALMRDWIDGKTDNVLMHIAEDEVGTVVGVAMVTLRPELLSHEPSAHLEAIAVSVGVEGQGIGQLLLRAAEEDANAHGAKTITLHVFANNKRARRFYERSGYDGELMRYIKPIEG
ncbi:MAG: GNAT family N-acetyltransferase [Proteobacteria bacterium]|nr:GNAT family N-acetyltransferase [Pseudomonadota bacterium]